MFHFFPFRRWKWSSFSKRSLNSPLRRLWCDLPTQPSSSSSSSFSSIRRASEWSWIEMEEGGKGDFRFDPPLFPFNSSSHARISQVTRLEKGREGTSISGNSGYLLGWKGKENSCQRGALCAENSHGSTNRKEDYLCKVKINANIDTQDWKKFSCFSKCTLASELICEKSSCLITLFTREGKGSENFRAPLSFFPCCQHLREEKSNFGGDYLQWREKERNRVKMQTTRGRGVKEGGERGEETF